MSIHAGLQSFLLTSAVFSAIIFFLAIAYSLKICNDQGKRWHYIVKVLALVIYLAAGVLAIVFLPKCGSLEAYKLCFEDCPLPKGFNHNAAYHVGFMIGTIVWAWSEDIMSSIEVAVIGQKEEARKIVDDFGVEA